MIFPFQIGDKKEHRYIVLPEDVATFNGVVVHPVCSTYTLAREMEWAGRLFVLEMTEDHEEGVGTHVHIDHSSPALVGETLLFIATLTLHDEKGNVRCDVTVKTEKGRIVASGTTGQRILPKTKINQMFSPPKS